MIFKKIAFVAANSKGALAAKHNLEARYDHVTPARADAIVALGGDGFMLETLHRYMHREAPIYGMNRGNVAFLMNQYRETGLLARLNRAVTTIVHPLRMRAWKRSGRVQEALAINEVSLLRQVHQAAKICIKVDGRVRIPELVCDGVLVATPAGSTAYNLSAYGPILPLDANVLALTPISAFRPRRWRGAILPRRAQVHFEVIEPAKRPVSATADHVEVRDVTAVEVREAPEISIKVLFDLGHNLDERILNEQFSH
jgi:NAD+ kinase